MGSSKLKYMGCSHSTKKDCFGRNKNGACTILHNTSFKEKDGKPKKCPFYKSIEGEI